MTNTVLIKRSGTANSVPTAGQLLPGELAINYADGNLFYKNTSNVVTTLASNKFSSVTGNVTGGNLITGGQVSATGIVSGLELTSTQSSGSEGGQVNLALPASGTTLSGAISIDVYNNQLRFFETGGSARGAYIDLSAAAAGVGSNLLAGGSSSTPTQIVNGTSNVSVSSSANITANVSGAWSASFYTGGMIANSFWANNNGSGQNFRVGDDAWIGDINLVNTVSIQGQQDAANAYIVFGNADGTQLGRAGSGPLTYGGAFSAVGNVSGNYILGNGSLLTGIITSVANINLGTSNVTVVSANGNVTVGVAGTSNVAVFASTGEYVTGEISATGNIAGGNVNTTNLSLSGNVVSALNASSSIVAGTTISAVGNITGGNIIQDGVRVAKFTTSETTPADAVPGDQWFIASTGKRYEYINDGTGNVWVDQSQSTSFDSLAVSGNATIAGNITGGNINATSNIYVGGTVFVRTLTVGTIGSSPVTIPLSSNNSFNVLTASGNVTIYTT